MGESRHNPNQLLKEIQAGEENRKRSLAIGWRIVVGEAAGGGSMTGGRVRSGFARQNKQYVSIKSRRASFY